MRNQVKRGVQVPLEISEKVNKKKAAEPGPAASSTGRKSRVATSGARRDEIAL
jgi:hypothetical protein